MISIIMATYNRAHFILEMLQSVQNQSYVDFECLIIDDGSTDNTANVVTDFIKNDNRFSYQNRPDNYKKGLPGVRNYGLDICKGGYIIFFDDDDIIHPDNLKVCLEVLQNNNLDFCHYKKFAFEKNIPEFKSAAITNKQPLSIADIESIVTQKIGIASCTVLWNKDCFKKHRFNEELMYAEEWECYIRMLLEGLEGVMIDPILYYYRIHPNSNTSEYYKNNSNRKASKKEAILLVIQKLNEKGVLNNSLLHYFIQMSLDFKEFRLFETILEVLPLNFLQKIKWQLFYTFLPLRLYLYQIKKKIVS
jgi:GalNAc5-diNAcBac-PP-undecaprenol beta-1,3-glucosyltransferase